MVNVISRLRQNANVHTAVAHEGGLRKMILFGQEMGWKFPYIPLDQPRCALFRLLAFIDWLAFKCAFSGDTVKQYYSNTKSWFLENAPFLEDVHAIKYRFIYF